MNDAEALAPGTLLAGKFRVERLLGAGAMGAVYLIRHELTRHNRALKLLHADVGMVPELVQRFLNEASAAGRAGNAHLIETFDAGVLPSGEAYVVMEMLEGETLSAELAREGRFEASKAAEYVAQTAEGIEAAHAVGIIHRDLKPDNLFVTTKDGVPFVKILDFGVSKFATESGGHLSQTRAGQIYGSPAYMSPEQLTGSLDIDRRTDVFALGVVLYQTLTGKLPFDAPTLQALGMRILTGDATPIESLRPDISQALIEVVRRALAADRDHRFPSARELAAALAPFRDSAQQSNSLLPGRPRAAQSDAPSPRNNLTSKALWLGLGVALVVGSGLVLVRQSRQPHEAAASEPSAPAPSANAVPAIAEPRNPLPAPIESNAAPVSAPEPRERTTRHPSPNAAASHVDRPAAPPAAAASAQPSTAESLGLHNDNPFR